MDPVIKSRGDMVSIDRGLFQSLAVRKVTARRIISPLRRICLRNQRTIRYRNPTIMRRRARRRRSASVTTLTACVARISIRRDRRDFLPEWPSWPAASMRRGNLARNFAGIRSPVLKGEWALPNDEDRLLSVYLLAVCICEDRFEAARLRFSVPSLTARAMGLPTRS